MSSLIKDISEKSPFGKTVKTFEVPSDLINEIHSRGYIEIPDEMEVFPNQPVTLKAGQQSALSIVNRKANELHKVRQDLDFFGIKARNTEQLYLQNILNDPGIRCIIITGAAGCGKSLCVGSYALHQVMNQKSHKKMILSKPLEIVTSSRFWGTTPGGEQEKFSPFLKSFQILFEDLVSGDGTAYIKAMIDQKVIDFMPLELMRGATLKNSICWYDEAQNLNYHECETLGSRIDDVGNTKLVMSGDLNQRDRRINKQRTGLWKLVTSPHFIKSHHTAHIHLKKIERGEIAELFFDIFDEGRDDK